MLSFSLLLTNTFCLFLVSLARARITPHRIHTHNPIAVYLSDEEYFFDAHVFVCDIFFLSLFYFQNSKTTKNILSSMIVYLSPIFPHINLRSLKLIFLLLLYFLFFSSEKQSSFLLCTHIGGGGGTLIHTLFILCIFLSLSYPLYLSIFVCVCVFLAVPHSLEHWLICPQYTRFYML